MRQSLKEFIRRFLPRSIRPYRILSGPLRSRVIYTSLHDYPAAVLGTTEKDLVHWLSENVKPGEVWLDIGAHYGYISLALAALTGAQGRVYAFEPMITTAGFLNLTSRSNSLPHLTIIPMALASSDAPAICRLPTTRGMADSILEHARDYETIHQTSLDRIWNDLSGGTGNVDGVKIDVQGMELDVLSGGCDFFTSFHPRILLEFHAGVDRSKIIGLLERYGYDLPGAALSSNLPILDENYQDNTSYLFAPKSLKRIH